VEATYEILEYRLPELRERLVALYRRAAKLSVPEIRLEILGKAEKPPKENPDGLPVRHVTIKLTGETPKLAGWTFVATLDPHETGNVVRAVPGEAVPRLYSQIPIECDHCRTNRRRRETYLVRHEDGHHKQVGSGCVKDFLGGLDPHALAASLEYLLRACDAAGGFGDPDAGCGGERLLRVVDVLRSAAREIRVGGWMSRSRARETATQVATADLVLNDLLSPPSTKRKTEPITEEDVATAEQALEWARALARRDRRSDFESNLAIVAVDESVRCRDVGLLCAAIPCWARDTERELLMRRWVNLRETSRHVGEIGGRTEWRLTVLGYRQLEGVYGTRHFYRFVDGAGNLLIWWGSRDLSRPAGDGTEICPRLGDEVLVRATVKKHDEYNGTAQTILSRVQLQSVAAATEMKEGT